MSSDFILFFSIFEMVKKKSDSTAVNMFFVCAAVADMDSKLLKQYILHCLNTWDDVIWCDQYLKSK